MNTLLQNLTFLKTNYKSRNDLRMYQDKTLESNTFLQPLLDKLSYENKNIILLGDFNIALPHYESHTHTRDFLDCMYYGSLSLQITITTKITPRSRKLIDIIFTNPVPS